MCITCIAKLLIGLEEKPVGQAGTQALKQMQEAKFELERRQKTMIAEVQAAVDAINTKYAASNKVIVERYNVAWDLVKTQLGLDPKAKCDIDFNTGQVTQTVKV